MIHLKIPDNEETQFQVCSSLDGLICLCENRNNSYYVYSPLTGENVVVPLNGIEARGCWLGLSEKSNEYKLLQFGSVEAYIHTLGTNSWRSIGLIPINLNLKSSYAPFLNGARHWVSDPPVRDRIC